MIVAKKNAARAVDRNRIKRFIRENFRLSQVNLNGLDIIVLAKYGVAEIQDFTPVAKLLNKQWDEIVKQWKQ